MNLSDLIDRHAAFTPDKTALRFAGRTLTYAAFAARIAAAARALKSQLGIGRGDRVAILSTNHPDYLVLLYACARLGADARAAQLAARGARAGLHPLRCLGEGAGGRGGFAAVIAPLLAGVAGRRMSSGSTSRRRVARRSSRSWPPAPATAATHAVDFSCPLLVVYTSGTTGRPKGAVLRQEALVWNAAMSQHMHALTSDDHVLTVLPLFHVGGLNIQTTPALQLGATVTIHPRFTPDAALAALGEDRPTLTVLVPATIQALIEHPRWQETDLSACARSPPVPPWCRSRSSTP